MPTAGLYDRYGRKIDYLRVSLTDRCNFRCVYCMPPEGEAFVPHSEILTYEEILRLCRITAALGVSRYKITGGEPFCRKGAVDFIRTLKALPGVEQTTITTNGALLSPLVEDLAAIGVSSLTVSLDSLSQEHFSAVTRSKVSIDGILAAMEQARARGIRIKMNVVPLKEYNQSDLPALTRFALDRGYHIRFIEVMPVGQGQDHAGVPQDEIKAMIEKEFGNLTRLEHSLGNGPADCFRVAGHAGSVGFIAALSKKFCHSCNRVRLTSLGFLKTCLHHDVGVDLKPLVRGAASDDELSKAIMAAVRQKPKAHEFSRRPSSDAPKTFSMNSVGG